MNCLTPEAISSYVRISMKARQEASELDAAYAQPGLAQRISNQIDLRRLDDAIRRAIPRTPKARIYDSQ